MNWRDLTLNYKGRIAQLTLLDPYELLEVSRTCSLQEAKHAFRRKIAQYHPDRQDPFMREFSNEVAKLLNAAIASITREKQNL